MEGTLICVYCLEKPAIAWSGHVKRGHQRITAGWCRAHFRALQNYKLQGFVGQFLGGMGERAGPLPMWPKKRGRNG